jgi:hypothetical protein
MYDLIRLLGMLWILPAASLPRTNSGFPFPLLVYAAPNALFLLAAFFLLVKFEEYVPYAYLYMAGKAVAIAANLGWFFLSLETLAQALSDDAGKTLFVLGFLLFLAVFDALSVLGISALVTHILGAPRGGNATAQEAADAGDIPAACGPVLPETGAGGSAIRAGMEDAT